MRDDAELVALAQAGDASAFAELYQRCFDRIYDFLARMVRDRAEAAELLQDTFLRAIESLPSLTQGASFTSWLFTLARNTALDRLQRSSRVQQFERRKWNGEEYGFKVVDSERFSDPTEAAEAARLAAVVWEAAEALEPRYYSVLHLSVREGLESAEIAEVLGVTRSNAYVMVTRTKQALDSAIGALALARLGRQECAELDATLASLETATMSPELRRAVDQHASTCPKCSERRSKLASPFAVFAAFTPLQAEPGIKAAILAQVEEQFAAQPTGGVASSGAVGATSEASPASAYPGSRTANAAGGFDRAGKIVYAPKTAGAMRRARRRRTLVTARVAALLLLFIGAPLAAFALLGGDDRPTGGESTAVAGPSSAVSATATLTSPTPTAPAVAESATPTATLTPTPTP